MIPALRKVAQLRGHGQRLRRRLAAQDGTWSGINVKTSSSTTASTPMRSPLATVFQVRNSTGSTAAAPRPLRYPACACGDAITPVEVALHVNAMRGLLRPGEADVAHPGPGLEPLVKQLGEDPRVVGVASGIQGGQTDHSMVRLIGNASEHPDGERSADHHIRSVLPDRSRDIPPQRQAVFDTTPSW